MAPMRGLSRAIVCVAATIIAIRFALHQRSVGESTTEPAKPTVRAQPVRAQPSQHTTDAPPPPKKKKKVAVFYNVYAPPRPHNRTCTSSKTWHKDGEPEGKESNIVQLARRLTTTQRLLPIFAPHLHRPVVPAGPAVAQLLEGVEFARVHEVGDDHGS